MTTDIRRRQLLGGALATAAVSVSCCPLFAQSRKQVKFLFDVLPQSEACAVLSRGQEGLLRRTGARCHDRIQQGIGRCHPERRQRCCAIRLRRCQCRRPQPHPRSACHYGGDGSLQDADVDHHAGAERYQQACRSYGQEDRIDEWRRRPHGDAGLRQDERF